MRTWKSQHEVLGNKHTNFVHPLLPENDLHLISPFCFTHESYIKVTGTKEMIAILKKLLIVEQILLISSIGNMYGRKQCGENA